MSLELEIVDGAITLDLVVDDTDAMDVEVSAEPEPGVALMLVPGEQGIPGPQGLPGTGVPIIGEVPTGAVDNVNTVFTTANTYRLGSLSAYLDGIRQRHFTETNTTTVTFESAPWIGAEVLVDYIIQ